MTSHRPTSSALQLIRLRLRPVRSDYYRRTPFATQTPAHKTRAALLQARWVLLGVLPLGAQSMCQPRASSVESRVHLTQVSSVHTMQAALASLMLFLAHERMSGGAGGTDRAECWAAASWTIQATRPPSCLVASPFLPSQPPWVL